MSDSVQPHRWQPTRLSRPWDSPGKNTGVGCHFILQCMKVKSESEVAQSCPTLSDPMDCSLPGSSTHWIFMNLTYVYLTKRQVRTKKRFVPITTSLVAQTVKRLSTMWETRVRSLGQKVPWRRKWQSTPVLLPGKSHGQRSLVGYSPWGRKESDTTEQSSP